MIIGGGITRYFGFEGSTLIHEGESSNEFYITDPHLYIQVTDNKQSYAVDRPLSLSTITDNSFHVRIETKEGPIDIDYNELVNRFVLCYTGIPRMSGTNNWEIMKNFFDEKNNIKDIFQKITNTSNNSHNIMNSMRFRRIFFPHLSLIFIPKRFFFWAWEDCCFLRSSKSGRSNGICIPACSARCSFSCI